MSARDLHQTELVQLVWKSADPIRTLHALAKERAASGWGQQEQMESMKALLRELRARRDQAGEDAVMHVMDSISGFCPRHSRIYICPPLSEVSP